MKRNIRYWPVLAAVVCALWTCAGARAQTDVDAAFSREVVVVNSEPAAAPENATSREAVVVNSEPSVAYAFAFSREAVLVNSETPEFGDAASREAIVYANEILPAWTQAFSREAVVIANELPIVDSFSREANVFNGYYLPEAGEALRIAGGLKPATPANMDRFALALKLVNATRINLAVATEIMRIATTLNP